jgi:hypothetical protein
VTEVSVTCFLVQNATFQAVQLHADGGMSLCIRGYKDPSQHRLVNCWNEVGGEANLVENDRGAAIVVMRPVTSGRSKTTKAGALRQDPMAPPAPRMPTMQLARHPS